jgi:hypothetical protein
MSGSSSLTPDALESLLGDLDEERFVAFVDGLWSRGGWTTDREGATLAVRRGGETSRLLVWTDDRSRIERLLDGDPDGPDAGAIDAVVTRRRDAASARRIAEAHDADVIDTDGLYDRLLYAIDRGAARELCGTYFGDDVEPRPPSDPGPDGRTIAGTVSPRTFLVAAALLALVAAVGVGLSGQPPGETDPAPETPAVDGGDTPVITPAGGGGVTADSPERAETPSRSLVPGREQFEELRADAPAYRNTSVSCMETPDAIVRTAVGALRFNDPDRNDGLRTVWRLADADNLSFERFGEGITSPIYRPLYEFDRVAFEPAAENETATEILAGATRTRAVVVAREGAIARYEFRLRRKSIDCWTIDQIFRTPIGGDAPADTATPTEANTSADATTSPETNTTAASDRERPGLPAQPETRNTWQDR